MLGVIFKEIFEAVRGDDDLAGEFSREVLQIELIGNLMQ